MKVLKFLPPPIEIPGGPGIPRGPLGPYSPGCPYKSHSIFHLLMCSLKSFTFIFY